MFNTTSVESAPIAIGVTNIEGNTLDCNLAMEQLIGYSLDELKAIHISTIYSRPKERDTVLRVLSETSQIRDFEVLLKRKDGSNIKVLLNIDQIEFKGKTVLLTTIRDINSSKP
ncbi:MAG: PAS domain S-box protein [Candidatus Hodarchaeales archaeon]